MSEAEAQTQDDSLPERIEQHERRLTELEIEAAFRRQASDDLDEVVRAQARRIDALERRLAELLDLARDSVD